MIYERRKIPYPWCIYVTYTHTYIHTYMLTSRQEQNRKDGEKSLFESISTRTYRYEMIRQKADMSVKFLLAELSFGISAADIE